MSLVLYDVTTLYFEAEKEDELRKVGSSKERRVDSQIVVGLLVDRTGFPLEIGCFEGNKAETLTIVPNIQAFQERHGIEAMVVVTDAGMLSATDLRELDQAGLRFVVGLAGPARRWIWPRTIASTRRRSPTCTSSSPADVQDRPTGQTDLRLHPRRDRCPPHDRVHRLAIACTAQDRTALSIREVLRELRCTQRPSRSTVPSAPTRPRSTPTSKPSSRPARHRPQGTQTTDPAQELLRISS